MKGIIFSAPMIRALLEGRKSVTRRPVKLNPRPDCVWCKGTGHEYIEIEGEPGMSGYDYRHLCRCIKPPYRLGEVVYVKETWGILCYDQTLIYKADCDQEALDSFKELSIDGRWHPSIHLRAEDARLHLEIVSVRPERLQEITEEEAIVEGFIADPPQPTWWQGYREYDYGEYGKELSHTEYVGDKPPDWMIEPHKMIDRLWLKRTAKNLFWETWDSIYRKTFPWESNPYVWRIEFREAWKKGGEP